MNTAGLAPMVQQVAGSLGRIGPPALAAAAGLVIMTAAVKKTTDYFLARAAELARYSGPISQATAGAEVRQMQADIREANRLGPDLARLVTAESRLTTAIQDMTTPLKQATLKLLTPVTEGLAALVEKLSTSGEDLITLTEGIAALVARLTNNPQLAEMLELMRNAQKANNIKENEKASVDAWLELARAAYPENNPFDEFDEDEPMAPPPPVFGKLFDGILQG